MSRLLNAKVILFSVALFSSAANADDSPYYTVEGSQPAIIRINPSAASMLSTDAESLSGIKTIQLRIIRASERLLAQNAINRIAITGTEKDYSTGITPFGSSSGAIDIGMNNVPVLDQGRYGTCVTFSSTAAVDARFSLGDYISQQCSLALDTTLGHNFWNGANVPSDILDPLVKHGIVTQKKCPVSYAKRSQKLSVAAYEALSDKTYSSQIKLTYAQVVTTSLDSVKAALKSEKRVLIGTYLAVNNSDPVSVNGFDITVGAKHHTGGLWACKQPGNTTNYCPPQSELNQGHEIVIIGYDDTQGLLKIRNSWNAAAGDNGDYYMTYAFFNSMVIDYTVVN